MHRRNGSVMRANKHVGRAMWRRKSAYSVSLEWWVEDAGGLPHVPAHAVSWDILPALT